jgi:hypothetical protein
LEQSAVGNQRQSVHSDVEQSSQKQGFCPVAENRDNAQVSRLRKDGALIESKPTGAWSDLNRKVQEADSKNRLREVLVTEKPNERTKAQSKIESDNNPDDNVPLPHHAPVKESKPTLNQTKPTQDAKLVSASSRNEKSSLLDKSDSSTKQVCPTHSNNDNSSKLVFKVRKTLKVQSERRPSISSSSQKESNPVKTNILNTTDGSAPGKRLDSVKVLEGKMKSKQDKAKGRPISKKRSVEMNSSVPTTKAESRPPIHESGRDANLVSVASLLVDLKCPSPPPEAKSSSQTASPVSNATRDDFVIASAQKQIVKLQEQMDALPKARSRLLFDSLDSFGSFPSQSINERTMNEHRATYSIIQKRLLQSAQATMRSLVQNAISAEGARAELKEAIRSFEETLVSIPRSEVQEIVFHECSPQSLLVFTSCSTTL